MTNHDESSQRYLQIYAAFTTLVGFLCFMDETGVFELLLLCLFQLAPIVYDFFKKTLHFVSIACVGFFGAYSIARFMQWFFSLRCGAFSEATRNEFHVYMVCTIGLIGLYSAMRYLLFRRTFFARDIKQVDIATSAQFMLVVVAAVPMFMTGLGLPFLNQVGSRLTPLAMAVILSAKTDDSKLSSWLPSLCLVVAAVCHFFVEKTLSFLVLLMLAWLSVSIIGRQRRHVRGMVVWVVLLFVLQSVKGELRGRIESGDDTVVDSASFVVQALAREGERPEAGNEGEGARPAQIQAIYSRTGDTTMETVLEATPSQVPYWNGATYSYGLIAVVPRFLWPDKPVLSHHHEFGVAYGIVAPDDEATNISFNYLTEGYMNFGFLGIAFAIALYVSLLLICEGAAYTLERDLAFSYVFLSFPFANFQAEIASIAASSIVAIIVLWIALPITRSAMNEAHATS